MQKAGTPWRRPTMAIMDLSYQIHQELSNILDPMGPKDWKHLVSVSIPIYTANDVRRIENEGCKTGSSCTQCLLQDLESRGYDVDQLEKMIQESGNEKALRCLIDGKSMMYKYTARAREQHGSNIKMPNAMEELSHVQGLRKREVSKKENKKNNQTQMSGTRETFDRLIREPLDEDGMDGSEKPGMKESLGMRHLIHQPIGGVGLHNPDPPGIRETLDRLIREPLDEDGMDGSEKPGMKESSGMRHLIHQPIGGVGLHNPDLPGTRETFDKFFQEPLDEDCMDGSEKPGIKESLGMRHLIHQQIGEVGLHNLDPPGTRETLVTDNHIQHVAREVGLYNPDPGTIETSRLTYLGLIQPRSEIGLSFSTQETNKKPQASHSSRQDINLPTENDEIVCQEARGPRTNAERLHKRSGSSLSTEEDENQLLADWSPSSASICNIFLRMLNCGSQRK